MPSDLSVSQQLSDIKKYTQPAFLTLLQTPDLMQQGLLADFIVAQQLFAFWLPDLCQPGSSAQKLFWKIAQPAWQQQSLLSVMGYYALQEVPCTS